ncbi:hypothetical protein [Modestobacter versicolor]|uniref:Uncharacterized protein n=1 Tax=Modestobacter versicolor TaxID=429133 RepID=A0A839Y1S4_9ACTN|nr:hypothetical protein [Modestobacter versicolor]MBB3677880.1 hypothetical protein [Modestobacter versicolor]
MNSPLDLAPRPRSVPVAEELDLAELLDLFAPPPDGELSPRESLRASGVRLLGWAQDSSRRAARWGAPGVSR